MSEESYLVEQSESQDDYGTVAHTLPYIETPARPSDDFLPQKLTPRSTTPPEIAQLLDTYQLGRIQKEFKNNYSTYFVVGICSCIGGIVCLTLLLLIVLNGNPYIRITVGMLVVGFTLLAYGINTITRSINSAGMQLFRRTPRMYLCTHGIMVLKGKQVQALRWDQVSGIQRIVQPDISSRAQQYTLYPMDDREPVILDRTFPLFSMFGIQLERDIAQRLLPESIASYQAGRTLNFGAINITAQGLSLEDDARELPWEKLGDIWETRGCLVIREKATTEQWVSLNVSTLLNLCVFLPLIKHIRSERRKKKEISGAIGYQPAIQTEQSEWQEYE